MSTIDNRIVKMQFDNAQFEAGVAQSMSTLDKLNEKLQFKDVDKSTSNLQKAFSKIDISGIESSLNALEKRFSAFGIAGMEIIKRITNSAIDSLASIEKATIGQIKTGGWNRAMNLANAQFTIEGLKLDWNEMLKAINYGVQDTAYGLDAAAKAAASLAASGVEYKETMEGANDSMMHTSLRAISGLAAMTNSSYEEIAHVFTRVAGNGRVMGEDLQSLSARGMNAAATLAEAFHTTEADIRDAVKHGEISFKMFATAMDNAFGEHAKEANKTFQGALSNVKAALSRLGAIFATPVINKTNVLFNALKGRINEVNKSLSDLTETYEENGKTLSRVVEARFATHFAEAWEAAMNAAVKMVEAVDLSWVQSIADAMDDAAQKATTFFNKISNFFDKAEEETQEFAEVADISVSDAMAAFEILFKGKYGNGKARIKALEAAGHDAEKVQKFINEFVKSGYKIDKLTMSVAGTSAEDLAKYFAEISKNGYDLTKTNTKLGQSMEGVAGSAEQMLRPIEEIAAEAEFNQTLKNLGKSASLLKEILEIVVGSAVDFAKGFSDAFKEYLDPLAASRNIRDFLTDIRDVLEMTIGFWSKYKKGIKGTSDELKTYADYIWYVNGESDHLSENAQRMLMAINEWEGVEKVVDNLATSLKHLLATGKNLATAAGNIGKAIFNAFMKVFNPVQASSSIEGLTGSFENLSEALVDISEKVAPSVEKAFEIVFTVVQAVSNTITGIVTSLINCAAEFGKTSDEIDKTSESADETVGVLDLLLVGVTQLAEGIQKLPKMFDELFKKLSENKGVIRLKDSISKLGQAFKDSANAALGEFSNSLSDMSQAGKKVTIDDVAEAIGWMADKIADVIDKIPGWITEIENFFGKIKEGVGFLQGAFDEIKINSPTFFEDIKNMFDMSQISTNITDFANNVGSTIKDAFENINWEDVKNTAIAVLALAELYKIIRDLNYITAVPANLGFMFGNISSFFKQASKFAKFAAYAKIIKTVVGSLVALCASIYVMGKIPDDILYRGIGVILLISTILVILMKVASKMKDANSSLGLIGNYVNVGNFGVIGQLALFVGAITGGVYLLLKAVEGYDASKFNDSVDILAAIAGGLVLIVGVLSVLISVLQKPAVEGNKQKSFAVAFLGISVFVLALAGAIAIISLAVSALAQIPNQDKIWSVLGKMGLLVLVIAAALGIVMTALAKVQTKQLLSGALVIGIFGLVVWLICKELTKLLVAMAALTALSPTNAQIAVGATIGSIVGVVLAVGAAIAMISSGLSKLADPKNVVVVMLAMIAFIGTLTFCLAELANVGDYKSLAVAAGAIVVLAGLMALILGLFAAAVQKKKLDPKAMQSLAIALAAMGAALMLVAIGLGYLTTSIAGNVDAFQTAVIAIAVLIAAFAVIAGLMATNDNLAENFLKIGEGFALLGLSATLVGVGLLLVVTALKTILPLAPLLMVAVDSFLTVLEKHLPIIVALAVVIGVVTFLVTKMAGVVLPFLTALVGLIKTVVEGVLTLLINGADKFKTWFSAATPRVKALVIGLIATLFSALSESGPMVLQKIGGFILMILDWIMAGIPTVVNKLVDILIVLINSLADALTKRSNSIAAALFSVVNAVLSVLLGVLRTAFIDIFGQKIGTKIANGLGLEDGQKALADRTRAMREEAEKLDAELDDFLSGEKNYDDYKAAKQAKYIGDEGWNTGAGYMGNTSDIVKMAKRHAGELSEDADTDVDVDVDVNVTPNYNVTDSGSGTSMADIVNQVKNMATSAGNEGGNDYISAFTNSVSGDNYQVAGMDMSKLGIPSEYLTDAGSSGGEDYSSALKNSIIDEYKSGNTQKAMTDAAEYGIVDPTREELEQLQKDCPDIANGAIDGMFNAFWERRKDFQGMIHNQYAYLPARDFEKTWQIGSPSKLFYKIASYAVQGLANGFIYNTDIVESATQTLSDQVIDSFTTPLEYIGALANGDLQYDPSIRPVLDSSNIAAGALGINDMFNNQNVTLSGLSGQLATDIGQLQGDNAAVVGELEGLRTDLADMTEQMTNLKVVMSNGALVGAISGDMDNALGQRAAYKRRGN